MQPLVFVAAVAALSLVFQRRAAGATRIARRAFAVAASCALVAQVGAFRDLGYVDPFFPVAVAVQLWIGTVISGVVGAAFVLARARDAHRAPH